MSASLDGRDINELRVVDLKAELDKRGLDKSGNKQALLERLQKAIEQVMQDDDTEKDMSNMPLNGTDKSMEDVSGDVLHLNTSLEAIDKSAHSKELADEKDAPKDDAPKEERDAKKRKQDAEGVNNGGAADGGSAGGGGSGGGGGGNGKAEVAVKEELEKSQALELHDEVLDDGKSAGEEAARPSAVAKTEEDRPPTDEDMEDVDGDCGVEMKDGGAAEEAMPNGAPAAGGVAEKTPASTAAAATAAKKDANKDHEGEKSSTSPSKIKERLVNDQNRNLWITNISQTTRATELKQALSEHGKVVGAKVVINARHPAACCYGYVRMETVADADNCIAKLNNTELNGQIIRIEKVRPDHLNPNSKVKAEAPPAKPSQRTPVRAPTPARDEAAAATKKERKPVEAPPRDDGRKDGANSSNNCSGGGGAGAGRAREERKSTTAATKPPAGDKDRARDAREKEKDGKDARGGERVARRRSRSRSRTPRSEGRHRRSTSASAHGYAARHHPPAGAPRREVPAVRKEKDILTFDKIKTERERERLREREREMRMRRREESERVKEIERRQRSEEARLERERQKIKEERERLERERAELMALERERQKREREKIELERAELQRAKLRMQQQEEERRAAKRPAPAGGGGGSGGGYRAYEERKRPAGERHFAEAPPPPRFDAPSSIKARDGSPQMKKFATSAAGSKDYKRLAYEKRDAYAPKRDYEARTHASVTVSRSAAGAVPKYESSSSSGYARERDMRTSADPRSSGHPVRTSSSSGMGSLSSSKYNSAPEGGKVRYSERDRSPHFSSRSLREERERRATGDSKSELRASRDHRYSDAKVDSVRYDRTSSSTGATWSQHKTFTPTTSSAGKPWTKDAWRSSEGAPSSGERSWTASASRPSMPFSASAGIALGPSCPPPPGINTYVSDRFEYKSSSMGSMRKY